MPQYQGIWTLAQAAQLQSTQRWATDPLFENTTLLLQADNAANGAQNNTFLDSSSNNFTITRNGNTTQGTFTPYSLQPGAWSTFFSSSYLTLADSADWVIDTDYTIEFWAYASSFPGQYNNFINQRGGVSSYWGINYDTSLGWSFFWNNGSGETKVSRYQDSPLNTWVHVAVVKSGTTGYMFLNGVQAGATFTFGSISDVASVLYIGSWFTPGDYFNGYLSNLRLVKGRAVYTSNFTPSTIPLGATSGGTNPPTGTQTKLLMSQSNYFIDNSPSPKTISIGGGTPSVQAFSPFAPQYQWTAPVIGGSMYSDGNGDYLTGSGSLSTSTSMNTFTVEGWLYPTSLANNYWIIGDMNAVGATNALSVRTGTNGDLVLYWYDGAIKECFSPNGSIRANQWNWFAIVVNNNAISMYINSTTAASLTGTTTLTNRIETSNFAVSQYNNSVTFLGYISNLRWSSGIARTISSIPTAPYTSDANTRLLLNFTNAGIVDGTMKNNLETVGNAQVSTSVVKYGTGSMAFDGTTDALSMPNSPVLQLGSADFTCEFWAYRLAAANMTWVFLNGNSSNYAALRLDTDTSGNIFLLMSTSGSTWAINTSGSAVLPLSTWTHIAAVRFGGTMRLYVNGVALISTTISGSLIAGTSQQVGANFGATQVVNGYLDDLRITKGIARYTANFTPPTVALPRQ